MTDQATDHFKDYFAAWTVAPCSISIAYLARYIDESWKLWNCRLVFGPKLWEKEEKWEVKGQTICAGSINLNLQTSESAKVFLELAIQGKLSIDCLAFELPSPVKDLSYYLSTTEHNPAFFSYLLRVTPPNSQSPGISHNALLSIDEELRCGSLPFDGLSDLLRESLNKHQFSAPHFSKSGFETDSHRNQA